MSNASHAPLPDDNNGWKASLSLSFESGPTRPIVRRHHEGPLTIQRPFYPEESVAHVYILHPPGGVVGGDDLSISSQVESGAAGLVTTPAATKFYRSDNMRSSLRQNLLVHGGSLEWFPQENIFFTGCSAELSTVVDVQSDAAVALWDIQCFGRPAGNRPFTSGSACSKLTLQMNGSPVFMDRLLVNQNHPLTGSTTLRGHSVSGTLLLNNMTKHAAEMARKVLDGLSEFCVTIVDSLLIVRYIGSSAQQAKAGFTRVWAQLRHVLNQLSPCVPRIWAT